MSNEACEECKALVDVDHMYDHLNWHMTLEKRFGAAVHDAVQEAGNDLSDTISAAARDRRRRGK